MYNKEDFKNLVEQNIKRDGIQEFMAWLETTDFYTAPASTVFHSNVEGGLVDHSVNVYNWLSNSHCKDKYSAETLAIVGLFHDICKANTTVVSIKNVKNEQTGQWEKQPYYKIENQYPFGHGEKSVYLLMKYMKLTDEEALAIDWHMGGFDQRASGYDLSGAMNQSMLVTEVHIADLRATFETENKNFK